MKIAYYLALELKPKPRNILTDLLYSYTSGTLKIFNQQTPMQPFSTKVTKIPRYDSMKSQSQKGGFLPIPMRSPIRRSSH